MTRAPTFASGERRAAIVDRAGVGRLMRRRMEPGDAPARCPVVLDVAGSPDMVQTGADGMAASTTEVGHAPAAPGRGRIR